MKKKFLSTIICAAIATSLVFGNSVSVHATEGKSITGEETTMQYDELITASGIEFTKSTATVTGYCGEGKDVVIPNVIDGVTVKKIGDNAFKDKGLNSIVLNEDLEEIGQEAFYNNNISELNFNPNLKIISYNAFENNKLKGELVIPAHIEEVREFAFANNELISIATLGENTTIKANAIWNLSVEPSLDYYKQGDKYFLDFKEYAPLIDMNKLGEFMLFNRNKDGIRGDRLDDSLMEIDKENGRVYFSIDPDNLVLNYSFFHGELDDLNSRSLMQIGFGQGTELDVPKPPVEEEEPKEEPKDEVKEEPSVPKTGDVASVGALAMATMVSLGGVVSLKKRYKCKH